MVQPFLRFYRQRSMTRFLLTLIASCALFCELANAQALTVLECQFNRRSSVFSSDWSTRESRLFLDTTSDTRTFTLTDFDVLLQSWNESFDTSTFRLSVRPTGDESDLISVMYQAPFPQGNDNHGLTGLVYVTHPTTRSELQYFCKLLRR